MAQEIITSNFQILPALEPQINSNTSYVDLDTGIEIDFNSPSHLKSPQTLSRRSYRWHLECRLGLVRVLKRLLERDLIGKDHI